MRAMKVKFIVRILLISSAYSISTDCPNMINLARGLGMITQQPAIWNQLQIDCCTSSGVICVSQSVTQIIWNNTNLNGFINATALPSGLQKLYLYGNQIYGSIPRTWPSTLQNLYLNYNLLTGAIPIIWPSGLKKLDLGSNQLNGTIPGSWPAGLQLLRLYNNQFTGGIPSSWPTVLQTLDLHINFFNGTISSSWPSGLQDLRFNWQYFISTIDISCFKSW